MCSKQLSILGGRAVAMAPKCQGSKSVSTTLSDVGFDFFVDLSEAMSWTQ